MIVTVANAQQEIPINGRAVIRLARCAITRLKITTPGTLAITFLDRRNIRKLNRQFLGHDRSTDVLSFRYDGESVVGEIFIAPQQAQHYAAAHSLAYQEELNRYVIHGLLHWLGHEDHTPAQQRKMRTMENTLLTYCSSKEKHQ